jgi:PAS domain-containing protein
MLSYVLVDIIPHYLQNFGQEIGNAWPITVALLAAFALFRWGYRKFIGVIRAEIKPIRDQVLNNGGTSLRDSVDRIEESVKLAFSMLEELATDRKSDVENIRMALLEENSKRRTQMQKLQSLMTEISNELSDQTFRVADTVFRQAVFNDETAYYTVEWNTEAQQWHWTWGNKSYHALTGLTPQEAKDGAYWDIIHSSEKDYVFEIADRAGLASIPLDVKFTSVNVKTKEETSVHVLAWPINDKSGKTKLYLGAIQVIDEEKAP